LRFPPRSFADGELPMTRTPAGPTPDVRNGPEPGDSQPGAVVGAAASDALTEAVNRLSEQNAHFMAILDAHPERISVVDPATNRVLYVNRHYRERLARDPVGHVCYEEFRGLDAPCSFCQNAKLATQPGLPHYWEFQDQHHERDFEITDLMIPWTDGSLVHYQLSVDITERKRSQRQLEAVIAGTVDGFWVCDLEGRLLQVNDSLCRMLGYARDELLRLTIPDLEAVLTPAEVAERIAVVVAQGSMSFETRHRRKDAVVIDVAVRSTWLDIEGGRLFVFVSDISERVQLQRRLEQNVKELARSNAELEQFAYLASHDLQEPLRKIQSFGDRLATTLEDRLDDKSRDYLTRMRDSAGRMQQLINDLLTYSRVGVRAQTFAEIEPDEIIGLVLSDLEYRLEQCSGRVEVGPLPRLEADPTQLRMLLQNLIANALKFHRPDVPPVVTVSGETRGDQVILSVADNGIGFDEKYKDRIFRIFQRLHPRPQYEGTGLGLAVCEKIAMRHGGTIDAASQPGAGATFTVTLPRRQAPREN